MVIVICENKSFAEQVNNFGVLLNLIIILQISDIKFSECLPEVIWNWNPLVEEALN